RKQLVRGRALGNECGDPTQGRLYLGETAEALARLRVDQRCGDELGELEQTVTGVCRERRPVLRGADGEDAPDGPIDQHGRADDGTYTQGACCLADRAMHAAVILDSRWPTRVDDGPGDPVIVSRDRP